MTPQPVIQALRLLLHQRDRLRQQRLIRPEEFAHRGRVVDAGVEVGG